MAFKMRSMRRSVGMLTFAGLGLLGLLGGCDSGSGSGDSPTTPTPYAVNITVGGLAGSGLVLQNNAGDDRTVSGNGSASFATALNTGTAYSVTVKTQPTGPTQTCSVVGGSGTVGSSSPNIAVNCVTNSYGVGGVVSGLKGGGLVLQDNGGDDLAIAADGNFSFPTPVRSGARYEVSVKAQPTAPAQACTLTGYSGVVGNGAVAVAVNCVDAIPPSIPVDVTVSGLAGTGLVLQNNGSDDLAVAANGVNSFANRAVGAGTAYSVTVKTQPATPAQTCTVSNGSGRVADAGTVIMATVTCVTNVAVQALQLQLTPLPSAAMGVLGPYVVTEQNGVALTGVAWSFDGQGGVGGFSVSGSSGLALHVWNTPGTHTVSATALASGGRQATVTMNVFAVNQPLAGGLQHQCALTASRGAKCWGNGNSGQLGNNSVLSAPTPVDVIGLSGLLGLAAGDSHSCALKADSTVACWGQNIEGELGNASTYHGSVNMQPLPVDNLGSVIALAAGRYHTCALQVGGTVACFGQNTENELGTASTLSQTPAAVTVAGLGNVVAISAGAGYFTCALKGDATVACWGTNASGQLGNNNPAITQTGTPQTVKTEQGATLSNVVAIRSGLGHSCAIVNDGAYSVWCWGNNANSQVSAIPGNHYGAVKQPGLSNVLMLTTTAYSSCALDINFAFSCWGMNALGESAGLGGTQPLSTPTALFGLQGASAPDYAAGGNETLCALKSDGSAACVGRGGNGQLGNGGTVDATTLQNVSAAAGTFWHWLGAP